MTNKSNAKNTTPSRDTVPWRSFDGLHAAEGVLTEAEIDRLSTKYDLTPGSIRELSQRLHLTFRPDLPVGLKPATVRETTSDKRKAGQKKVKRANDLIRMALSKLNDASAQLADVRFKDPYAHIGRPNDLNQRLEELMDAISRLEDFRAFLDAMERAGLAFVAGAPDARKVMDVRRTVLCTLLFNLWLDHDRPLTFTTDPGTGERKGMLFDFVNDVVMCLTDPQQKLNGETLRLELQAFKGGD